MLANPRRSPPPPLLDPLPAGACADANLLPSLGRLARGLTLLFWGLPLTLVVCVQTAHTSLLGAFGMLPPVVANAVLLHALLLAGGFRPQERIWQRAVERARLLAVINLGLSPFLHWWKLLPDVAHYQVAVAVMACTGLLFLVAVNLALRRLAAMLPDQTLRLEARLFTNLNLGLLVATAVLTVAGVALGRSEPLAPSLLPLARLAVHLGLAVLLVLVLLPLALTMTLLWKIKETILTGVFGTPKPDSSRRNAG
jgi:hypothetical protein